MYNLPLLRDDMIGLEGKGCPVYWPVEWGKVNRGQVLTMQGNRLYDKGAEGHGAKKTR